MNHTCLTLPPDDLSTALEQLPRERLAEIADHCDLEVEDWRIRDNLIDAIEEAPDLNLIEVLPLLRRDELRDICDALDLDTDGREKHLFIRRILGRAVPVQQPTQPPPQVVEEPSVQGTSPFIEVMDNRETALRLVEKICRRFELFVSQMGKRSARNRIDIQNELDVQELLHSILRIHFDDIEHEAGTESHAGGSSRLDFLLGEPQIGLEVKLVGAPSADRRIGEEILVDVNKYKKHSECKALVFFIYDPARHLKNPIRLERNLSEPHEPIPVKVIVAPK